MSHTSQQDDIFARVDELEHRLRTLEGGPLGDSSIGFYVRSSVGIGTAHVGAVVPEGGESGDVKVGTGKIWVNDGGIWKSVAVT